MQAFYLHFRTLTILLFITCFSCRAQEENKIEIPFRLIDNRIFVEVEVNGVAGHFIVDSGGLHGFNKDFADEAGIHFIDSSSIGGAGNGRQTVWYGERSILKLPTSNISSTTDRPLVINLNTIRDSLRLPYLDGIIGEQLFRTYRVSINYPNRLISLQDFETPIQREGYEVIPFRFYRNQIPMIKINADGNEGEMIIDTGDRSELTIFPEFDKKGSVSTPYPLSDLEVTGYGVGGPVMARAFYLKDFTLGESLKLQSVKTRIPYHTAGSWAQNAIAGSIGSGLLKDFEVIFDYQKQLILLKKAPLLSIPEFVYHASHIDSTVSWYETYLPFERVKSSKPGIVLEHQKARIRFIDAPDLQTVNKYRSLREGRQPNGVFKFGFDVVDIRTLYNEMISKPGVQVRGRLITFWATHMFLVRDPEGQTLQFFEGDTGNKVWKNSFYAFITDSEDDYNAFLSQMQKLNMVPVSNFDNVERQVKQRSFEKGNVKIELLQSDTRAENAYIGTDCSGIKLSEALNSLQNR
ncbi:hypothetical protein GCM10009122_52010 [Fulvivirga kasyanovii]